MPFLRLSRDRRGYESTFLLHAAHPGERPRVLYWYRTAPGVRVGRPPLDEDAIRAIEEQHPDIEFDWPHILEVGAAAALMEAEHEAQGRAADERGGRRRKGRSRPQPPPEPPRTEEPAEAIADERPAPAAAPAPDEAPADEVETAAPARPRAHNLLEELVGREIATRLHARYAELSARISQLPVDELVRDAWRTRAEAINPDNWVTPDEVLAGVERADALFDEMRTELPQS